MEVKRTIEWLRVFGLPGLAILVAIIDLAGLYRLQVFASAHRLEAHLIELIAVVAGLVAALAPYEVSSWTGRYGWTRATYRTPPEELIRWIGIGVLAIATFQIWGTPGGR